MKSLSLPVLIRFTLVYIGLALLLGLLANMFEALSNSTGIVASMVAALAAGQIFYSRNGRRPDNAEAWMHAAAFTLIQVLASLPLAYYLLRDMIDDILAAPTIFLGVMAVFTLVIFLVSRLFFGMGAKQMDKVKER